MLKSFYRSFFSPFTVGLIATVMMLALSFGLRQPDFEREVGAQNLAATYHVLLTINAMNESAVKNHWYLPSVSLGSERDKYIPWGATVPTKTGDYIYTSFAPPGFLAPYVAFLILDVEPSVKNLARFNSLLGAATAVIAFILLSRLLNFVGHSPRVSACGALVGSSIAIFSREALLSNGLIYWSQSLYQLLLVGCLWFIFKHLSVAPADERQRKYTTAIAVIAFLGALTEWTGYIFNVGLILLFWIGVRGRAQSKSLSIRILLATVAAGVLTLIHFSLAVGFQATVNALVARFLVRNTSSGTLAGLMQGYGLSYGAFLFVLILLPLVAYHFADRKQPTNNRQQTLFFIFVAAVIPLTENIVMLQHATQFSFDRLKFIFPAAMILATSFSRLNTKWRIALCVLILLACSQGYKSYRDDLNAYEAWGDIDSANRRLAAKIAEKVDVSCAVFSSNIKVRGYANLLFHRGIYEGKPPQASMTLMKARGGCAAVYLEGSIAYPDLPMYTKATVAYPNGTTIFLNSENSQ